MPNPTPADGLTDKQVQRKLDQLVKIANELVTEGKRRYGEESILFFEADGDFHLMEKDVEGSSSLRQEGIRFSSHRHCMMDCGAW